MIEFKYDQRTSGVQCHYRDRYFVIKDADLADPTVSSVMGRAIDGKVDCGLVAADVWVDLLCCIEGNPIIWRAE